MQLTVSRIVHYTLTQQDADAINKRRRDASDSRRSLVGDGVLIHFGNSVSEGDVLPLLVVKVWENGLINGQVFLDGNDTLWVTSIHEGSEDEGYLGHWSWPTRV